MNKLLQATDNEHLALFMGMTYVKTKSGLDTFWHPTEVCRLENWKYHSLDLDNFYPKSWDWLMPVVIKIMKMKTVFEIRKDIGTTGNPEILLWMVNSGSHGQQGDTLQDSLYKSVVSFVKWYNTQNQITNEIG